MKVQKIMTKSVLLLSLLGLTACPGNTQDRTNTVAPNQIQTMPPANNNPGGNLPGNQPQADMIMKNIQCEFEGQRNKSNRFFSANVNIPKTISLISLDSRYESSIDLRTKFLGFDIGKFGKIMLQYVPASKTKSGTDTLILIDEGLNKNLRMSQSSFAGQVVKLEAQSEDMFVTISCKGTTPFKSGTANTSKTSLVCHGKSNTLMGDDEQVNVTIPLNSIQAGQEFTISNAVSGKLDSASTMITFIGSLDPEYGATVTSTASLKSSATFRLLDISEHNNSSAEINLTCKIQ